MHRVKIKTERYSVFFQTRKRSAAIITFYESQNHINVHITYEDVIDFGLILQLRFIPYEVMDVSQEELKYHILYYQRSCYAPSVNSCKIPKQKLKVVKSIKCFL